MYDLPGPDSDSRVLIDLNGADIIMDRNDICTAEVLLQHI
jgi:hypothetical protein